MALYIQGCPKPLSRKKARQIMSGNHKSLTAPLMAGKGHHKPGPGRYGSNLRNEAERIDDRLQESSQNSVMTSQLKAALTAIRNLLNRRKTSHRVVETPRAS